MTQTDYEQKKRECWEEFCQHIVDEEEAFYNIFDRAYALGKQTETITQEEVESEAKDYAYNVGDSDWEQLRVRDAFVDGANFALGKQEKDAEDTVIQGWVCRDKKDNALNLHAEKPYRAQSGYDISDEPDWWESDCASFLPLDKNLFPDLTWESEPQECEIIIKRKRNEEN